MSEQEFKAGDKVWSAIFKKWFLLEESVSSKYPILVKGTGTYTRCGRHRLGDTHPDLFYSPDDYAKYFNEHVPKPREKKVVNGWLRVYKSGAVEFTGFNMGDNPKNMEAFVPIEVEYYEGQGLEDGN